MSLILINGVPRQQLPALLYYDQSITVVSSGASGANQINASPANTAITLPLSGSYSVVNGQPSVQIFLNGDRTEIVFDWNTVGSGPSYTQFSFTFAVVAGDRIDIVYNSVNEFYYLPFTDASAVAVWESDSAIIQSAGSVTNWFDRTPNVTDATQSTTSKEPTIAGINLNGRQVLQYAIGNLQTLTQPGTLLKGNTTPFTLVFLTKFIAVPSATTFQCVFSSLISGQTERFFCEFSNFSGYSNIWVGSHSQYGYTSGSGIGANPTLDTNWHKWMITYNGAGGNTPGNYAIYLDDVLLTNVLSGTLGAGATVTPHIGTEDGTASPANYYMAGLYVFDVVLTGTQLTNFNNYITLKWGL